MTVARHLSWDNFRSTVFVRGQQRVHRVFDVPRIEIFGDGTTGRIGMWLQVPPHTLIPEDISKLAFVSTRTIERDASSFLEIATAAASLQRQFYHFMVAVSERVIVEGRPVAEALALEVQCFTELLQEKNLLGIERQLGLLGELIFLRHLIDKRSASMLDAWVGPTGEPHDFRLQVREFEVKTTVSPHRIHTIHGAEQLVASKDCSLALISVLLGPPGASVGFSLPEIIEALSLKFAPVVGRLPQFVAALEACGFRSSDAGHYGRRYILRRPIAVVPIDAAFPALTRPVIQAALGTGAERLDALQYDVDVDGLEHEEHTKEFAAAIADRGEF